MKKIIGALLGGAVFVVGSSAYALSLAGAATGGVQVGAGYGAQAGVSATTSVQSQTSSSMDGLVNVNVGTGLQAQVQVISANTSSENAVVQLQGNTVGLIQSDTDLMTYNNLVIQARPVVKAINVHSDNSIAIDYSQPAKLFGIFPTSLSGEVDVDAQGNTTVHLPWYAFLYAKNTANVQTSVAAAVQQSGASFGAQANAQAQLQDSARVISAVSAALQAQASASAGASANAGAY
jgi:hypothetical protein